MTTRQERRRAAVGGTTSNAARGRPAAQGGGGDAPAAQRTRSRAGASTNTNAPASGGSVFRRGRDVLAGAEQARKEAEQRREGGGVRAFRFWLNKGEEAPVIILDNSLEEGIAFYEHHLFDQATKTMEYAVCSKEVGYCKHCNDKDYSRYMLYLTILDLRPYTNKDGKVYEQTKKLLPIPMSQIDDFKQLQDVAAKQGKGMRGMYLVLRRGRGDKDPKIGKPAILENGMVFDIIPEDELYADYGHDAIRNDKGEEVRHEDWDITPHEYDKLFVQPTADEPRSSGSSGRPSRQQGEAPRRRARPGSRQEAEEVFEEAQEHGQDDGEDVPYDDHAEDDDIPFEETKPVRRRASVASSGDPLEEGA